MPSKTVVVIGAGIVGAATALWLQRAGRTVILIDKGRPGMGTSFGNAGILASSAIVPVTTPGLIPKAPRYLLDPNFPLFMRWTYLPRLVPWLIKYLSHANHADTRRIAKGLNTIIGDSLEQHQALARGTAAEPFIQPSDYVFAYKDRAAFDADKYIFDIRAEAGFHPEIIEGPSVQERDRFSVPPSDFWPPCPITALS